MFESKVKKNTNPVAKKPEQPKANVTSLGAKFERRVTIKDQDKSKFLSNNTQPTVKNNPFVSNQMNQTNTK